MTKLEAIARLQQSFKHLPEFRKKWEDYIQLIILEDTGGLKIKEETRTYLAQKISKDILDTMFQADWWEAQGLK